MRLFPALGEDIFVKFPISFFFDFEWLASGPRTSDQILLALTRSLDFFNKLRTGFDVFDVF
jgi:hypothetical protein